MPSTARPTPPRGRALWRAFLRPGVSQFIVGVMIMAVVAGGLWLVRNRAQDETYSQMRRPDLIALIDTLDTDSARLEGQIRELEKTLADLQSGADKQQAAAAEAAKRAGTLSVLAGTAPAVGPGIRMVISDPQGRFTSQILLDAVQELRDSGAEVIEIDDKYRIVGTTWFGASAGVAGVNGEPLGNRVVIEAIGDPNSLEEGARFRGGIVSRIESAEVGGEVSISRLTRVDVDSVVTLRSPEHARPR